ncbi:MAG: MerR family DNA-binding transcriptional regulator [Coriobacteriia bacterium]|nr:MerR family DNA-binding transcriptional regulator [Coriobacteriia bacterium]
MSFKGLLSISEFSKLTGIPRSKLIYYDEIGLFPAAERGDNNYRYYTLNQIIIAGFLSDMASFGISLKELLATKDVRTPEIMLDLLERASKEHQKKIAQLRETLSVMGVMIKLIKEGMRASNADIEVLDYAPHNFILGKENLHQEASTFYPAWLTFMNSAQKAGLNIKYPVGAYFNDMDRFVKNPNMPSRFYFVNPHGKTLREGGKYLAGYVRGFYGQADGLPERMLNYAKEHGLKLAGPVYNTFLLDEICIIDHEQYLLRASIKIVED